MWSLGWSKIVSDLHNLLEQVNIVEYLNDSARWNLYSLGWYSIKHFQQHYFELQMKECQYNAFLSKVLFGLCPLKSKLLMWLLMQGRINTRDRLQCLNILGTDNIRYALCDSHDECILYLFFTC